jgi:WD40 repeat protein
VFSPDGTILASTSDGGKINLWDVASGRIRTTIQAHVKYVLHTAFSPDGRMLASVDADGAVRLWNAASGESIATLPGHQVQTFAVAFSPDGKSLASASGDCTVKIWDVATRLERATLKGHSSGVWSVAYSPDGKTLVSAAMDDDARLWNAESGSLIRTIPGIRLWANFSRDGKTLETRGVQGEMVLWDLRTNSARATIASDSGQIRRGAAFFPDGKRLMASGSRNIEEIDISTGERCVLLPEAKGRIWSLAISPDGQTVVTGNATGNVRFWRAASDQDVTEQGTTIDTTRAPSPVTPRPTSIPATN